MRTFSSAVYGFFIREQRHQKQIRLEAFSRVAHYSPATISLFENGSQPFEEEKFRLMLHALGFEEDYMMPLEKHLDEEFHAFAMGIIYEDDTQIDTAYQNLKKLFKPYEKTILASVLDLCDLIYHLYQGTAGYVYSIDRLEKTANVFSQEVLFLYDLYMAQHAYSILLDFPRSLAFFSQAQQIKLTLNHHPYFQMYHYLLSHYYAITGDYENCLVQCKQAAQDFTEAQNFPRLVNVNIQTARAYMILRDYSRAQQIHLSTLPAARRLKLVYELESILYNMAYIEILRADYQKAEALLRQIPSPQMKGKYYVGLAYTCLCLQKYDQAKMYLQQAQDTYLNVYLEKEVAILDRYLQRRNAHQTLRELANLYAEQHTKATLDQEEIWLTMIVHFSRLSGQYKKGLEYMEMLYRLRFK